MNVFNLAIVSHLRKMQNSARWERNIQLLKQLLCDNLYDNQIHIHGFQKLIPLGIKKKIGKEYEKNSQFLKCLGFLKILRVKALIHYMQVLCRQDVQDILFTRRINRSRFTPLVLCERVQ